jgi:hypothetical protein
VKSGCVGAKLIFSVGGRGADCSKGMLHKRGGSAIQDAYMYARLFVTTGSFCLVKAPTGLLWVWETENEGLSGSEDGAEEDKEQWHSRIGWMNGKMRLGFYGYGV